ncbi:MAG: efflux RND transporter periplasmic adaptor subunit [Bacteroidia bacterium]
MKFIFVFIFGLLSLMLPLSCSNPEPAPAEAVPHADHEPDNSVFLTAEQMKSIGIAYGSIEKKQLTASLRANGLLKVPNQNKATATALMGGVIRSILVQPGNKVVKGQVLATLTNTSFVSMQEEFLSVSYRLDYAELEYNRQKELNSGNAGSLKVLQQAETERNTLKSKKAGLQKQLELLGLRTANLSSENIQTTIQITSPISGSVSSILVNIGTFVDPNNPVAEIIDNSQLHLDLFVYEKDLSRIRVGQTIHFTLTNNPGQEYDADVFAISNTFEEHTKAVAVHALVKGNKEGLIDGIAITALASLEEAVLDAVPDGAIINHDGQDYIFITAPIAHDHDHGHVHADSGAGLAFERIPVRKGTSDLGYTEIALLTKIPKGSRVVVQGAFFVMAQMTNQGQAHGHEH